MTTRDDARDDALELLRDEPYGAPSDVWALGVVLYETCAAGARPFETKGKGWCGRRHDASTQHLRASNVAPRGVAAPQSGSRSAVGTERRDLAETGSQSVLDPSLSFGRVPPPSDRGTVATWW